MEDDKGKMVRNSMERNQSIVLLRFVPHADAKDQKQIILDDVPEGNQMVHACFNKSLDSTCVSGI